MPGLKMLALKNELTAVEALSVITAGGVVFAAIYNFGFFASMNTSFVSVLTLQDLVIGSALSIIPAAAILEATVRFEWWLRDAKGTRRLVASLLVGLLAIGIAIAIWRNVPAIASVVGTVAIALPVSQFLVDRFKDRAAASPLWVFVAAFVFNFIYSVGSASYQLAISNFDPNKKEFEIVIYGESISGRVVRVTTNYTFVFDGASLLMLPNNKIASLRKLIPVHGQ